MANWVRYPPPLSERFPPWRACEVEVRYPPPQKGYLSDTGAIPYENKAKACDTPLCDTISKGYCAIWGGISHWAAKRRPPGRLFSDFFRVSGPEARETPVNGQRVPKVLGTDIPRTSGGHSRGYPGPKLRPGRSKSWKNRHLGADIHDPKAQTSTTLRDFQKLRSEKLRVEFSFPTLP